jgi:primosomal protein N' (replication factor Y)
LIARVTLDLAVRKEFDYLVPEEFRATVKIGTRVKVPFGPRSVLGVVTALPENSPHTNLRPILKALASEPLVTPNILKLARWIAQYYCAPVELALRSALPEAVRKEEPGWKQRLNVRRLPPPDPLPDLPKKQKEIWDLLQKHPSIGLQELIELGQTTSATIRRLEEKHLIEIAPAILERDPYEHEVILPTRSLALNSEQAHALELIKKALEEAPVPASLPFLLHGVTGSGKTEVYLQALAHALSLGKGGIVLVPEISLTPQTVERFKARFNSGPLQTMVAVLHSHLSAGERHDEWQKIRSGRARVVIGARSAIFAPVEPLGLIVVDEEHEHSYKQEETPRYNARDVAVMRASFEGAVTILGSATPSMESFFNAQKGKYTLVRMPSRADDKKLPLVRVVDLRLEGKGDKGPPMFSVRLKEGITRRLEQKEQVILFLNRRGYSSSLQCPKCGYVAGCPNCSISLTYHRKLQKLCCHICGHQIAAPSVCPEPKCRNPAIRFAGLGTEKVEETLGKLFPHARVARMDSDTLKRKEDYRRVLGDFKTGKIDIIIGTQMIAKGLHFPNVTLVGIIYADLSLHIPDFRSGERTFQLLTQVAGRAGRGDVEGEVIVQAFTPFHPAIQFARQHDYDGFYEQEIEFREQLRYPPVARAALLTFKSRVEEKAKFTAEHVKKELEKALTGIRDLVIAGPAPSPLLKAESFFRYQIMLRTVQMTKLSQLLAKQVEALKFPDDVTLTVDIDPLNLF